MIWGRDANILTESGRIAEEADAYTLAAAFGSDFSETLVKGASPFEKSLPSLPSSEKLSFLLGGAPKYHACDVFGRSPGVMGLVGDSVGLPPGWTDKGGAKQSD